MNKFINGFLDFFLPRLCASCDSRLSTEEDIICPDCISVFQFAEKERLMYEFQRKFTNTHYITDYFALFIYERDTALQEALFKLKYKRRFGIGYFFGKLLFIWYGKQFKEWKIDLIIPVPLHHLKKAERGYNQSLYIAKGLSKQSGITLDGSRIKKNRFTESQTKKKLVEREQNIQGAFEVRRPNKIKGKNILLIDDIITTGATIRECAKSLITNGASKIYAGSVAIAD